MIQGPTQAVNITTEPPGAQCDVGGFTITSPGIVVLPRSYETGIVDSSSNIVQYQAADFYPVRCKLPGHEIAKGKIWIKTDWGFVFDDILFGGFIMGLIVDYAVGNAGYDLRPDVLSLNLKSVGLMPVSQTPTEVRKN